MKVVKEKSKREYIQLKDLTVGQVFEFRAALNQYVHLGFFEMGGDVPRHRVLNLQENKIMKEGHNANVRVLNAEIHIDG